MEPSGIDSILLNKSHVLSGTIYR